MSTNIKGIRDADLVVPSEHHASVANSACFLPCVASLAARAEAGGMIATCMLVWCGDYNDAIAFVRSRVSEPALNRKGRYNEDQDADKSPCAWNPSVHFVVSSLVERPNPREVSTSPQQLWSGEAHIRPTTVPASRASRPAMTM